MKDFLKKTSEMGRACSTYGGRGQAHRWFGWANIREGDHLKHLGVVGRIILI
jgi:hypothetical protein